MKIIHFDGIRGIDGGYIPQDEQCVYAPFDEKYNQHDQDVEILTCMHSSHIDARVSEVFPNLRYVITRTVGTDHIDKNFCDTHGIAYFSVGQYGPHVIATHALSLLLLGARDLHSCDEMREKGSYDYSSVHAIDLMGRTITVIGVGNIGKHILKMAHGFGMKLQGYDVYEDHEFAEKWGLTYVSLETAISSSDVICLACNLTPENRHMIDAQAITQMKDGVILINIARGELIDEDALLAHYAKFAFVGLDVIALESAL